MAKGKKKTKADGNGPNPQGSENKEEKNGLMFGLLAFLVALTVMIAVFAGAFFIVVHNDVNGIATKYRKQIQNAQVLNIHFLKWALPKAKDPEDPKNLTDDEIVKKYNELRKTRDDLGKQLETANAKIKELQKYKDQEDKVKADADKIKQDADAQKKQLDAQKKQIAADKKKLDELIASGDKAGFKQYFEKVDPANAQKIYADIVKEQKATDDVKKLSKLYEGMDPAASAGILEQLGEPKINLIVDILKNMNKDAASQIMAAMTPALSASVTEKMASSNSK